ncbi:MAG TPA: NADH-quinone oxidoreductase subunit F, partial [Acidobacteriota bacterium]|nr:NADH-quinone oxidoreductase subunit F [Acidobacteriota bacterium]
METRILLSAHGISQIELLEVYRKHGGYKALERAKQLGADGILQEVEKSGLRGRGGAGFSTFLKWQAVASQQRAPHYFVCNAAEGEPGSFKDRELLKNPHQVLEATAISAYAVGAEQAFLYLRGLFTQEEELLKR